tara:strand:- start:928 stop:1710 length:783 start_codon:yes stop_codon:yes gene_type:complete
MSKKQRKMQEICANMQQWTRENMHSLDIYECNYSYYDLEEKIWITLPCVYPWYREYIDKSLDHLIYHRLKPGFRYWKNTDLVYRKYKGFVNYSDEQSVYKCDLIKKNKQRYELLVLSCKHPIPVEKYAQIYQKFHQISYDAHELMLENPELIHDFRGYDIFLERKEEKSKQREANNVSKSEIFQFNGFNLNKHEIEIIEELISLMSYQEIASKHNIKVEAVYECIEHIKFKLKVSKYPDSHLFKKLRENSVLMSCINSYI